MKCRTVGTAPLLCTVGTQLVISSHGGRTSLNIGCCRSRGNGALDGDNQLCHDAAALRTMETVATES